MKLVENNSQAHVSLVTRVMTSSHIWVRGPKEYSTPFAKVNAGYVGSHVGFPRRLHQAPPESVA